MRRQKAIYTLTSLYCLFYIPYDFCVKTPNSEFHWRFFIYIYFSVTFLRKRKKRKEMRQHLLLVARRHKRNVFIDFSTSFSSNMHWESNRFNAYCRRNVPGSADPRFARIWYTVLTLTFMRPVTQFHCLNFTLKQITTQRFTTNSEDSIASILEYPENWGRNSLHNIVKDFPDYTKSHPRWQ